MPKWLEKAIFYEIYPQSFYDTNGDGIGDLQGVIEKLDYVNDLGCNTIWLNPCFESPFQDAGYDISDYKKIAERYGENDDMKRLIEAAHARDMRIILDLVPGHTSVEHPWFKDSMTSDKSKYSNRYIWTNLDKDGIDETLHRDIRAKLFRAKDSERVGNYMFNYYDSQPALNYGFGEISASWQLPVDHPDCIATMDAMKDIMRFWLDMNVDGFRVDMAFSLVKSDTPDRLHTRNLWKGVRKMFDAEYPEAALISEWFIPKESIDAGFHMDFYLQASMGYISLLMTGEFSYFHRDGKGDASAFAKDYMEQFTYARKNGGIVSTPTGNHDVVRMSHNRSEDEIKIIMALVFSLPGVPGIYYGDEIGLRYQDIPSVEGGLFRTGSRTPMQWDDSKHAGFSTAGVDDEGEDIELYLPIDPEEDRPTVKAQETDPKSVLNFTRHLIALRKTHPALGNTADFKPLYAEESCYPFVFARISDRQRIAVCFNPSSQAAQARVNAKIEGDVILSQGGDPMLRVRGNITTIIMQPESFAFVEY